MIVNHSKCQKNVTRDMIKNTTYHLKDSHKSCQKLFLVNNSNMYNSAAVPEEWNRDSFRNSLLFPYITHGALTGLVLIITN